MRAGRRKRVGHLLLYLEDQAEVNNLDISITGHSAIFTNLLVVINHQPYPLATGEMIPVVVKATRVRPSA